MIYSKEVDNMCVVFTFGIHTSIISHSNAGKHDMKLVIFTVNIFTNSFK